MDWNMKAPSWDLTELDQATLANKETADGSSRFGVQRTTGEFSVDLKLGQVGNSGTEPVAKWKDVAGFSKVASSPSGSSKRARAINSGTQTVSCLVDGCNSDLSNCRDYHRRHKVCELHSKTPEVTIGGHKQRFCQQCSRFHSLEEFDEGKRSCRKRLDGHNRRRRKPQPEAIARSGSFLSNYQGTQFLPFSSSHVYPSTAVVNSSWNGGATSCGDVRLRNQYQQMHLADKQDLFLGSSSSSCYKEVKQLAFLQGDNSTIDNQNQTFLRGSPLSESEGFRSKIFCDGLTSPLHDRDSRCALSLLSSPQTHTPVNGLSQMVQPHSMSLMQQQQPLALSLPHNSLDSVDVEPVLVPHGGDHCPAMYNINEAPQPFPFLWE